MQYDSNQFNAQPHRVHRQLPAAPMRHRHVHNRSVRGDRHRTHRHNVHCSAGQRRRSGLRLPVPRAFRTGGEGHRFVSPRRRLPEHQQRRSGLPAARVRHLRRSGGQPHSRSCANCACPSSRRLHTILREPDPDQRRVLEEVAALSDRVVVMSERGAEFLHEIYRRVAGRRSI